LHAIKPDTLLATKLHWRWSGEIKPSKQLPWMDVASEQVSLRDRGFAWKARMGKGPVFLTAADHYRDGEGRMKVALFGILPVVNETGPDLAKGALGRLLAEGGFMPSSLLPGPHVSIEGVDDSTFKATINLHGEATSVAITVDRDGKVTESVMQRWGNVTDDGSYRFIPYGGVVEEEQTFGGYTIPTRTRGGWWYGTDQYMEVLHLKVDSVRFE
jgi:hypothetical protein